MTSLKELYFYGRNLLREREPLDALLLCEEYLGADRKRIALHGESIPALEQRERYLSALRRRAGGEPLQYILGYAWFQGMRLSVGEGVLIPREDTAALVDRAAEFIGDAPMRGMDLCAGTGAVALAIARACPEAAVTAAELHPIPLRYLRQNASAWGGGRVTPTELDVLAGPSGGRDLDFIVSNPPYIESRELPLLQEEVRREPPAALDGGADGLRFYRAVASLWSRRLRPGGLLAFEIGETQAQAVSRLLAANGFSAIRTDRDLNGLDRVVSGIYEGPAG